MGAEHEETQYLQIIFLRNIPDSEEIPKGIWTSSYYQYLKAVVHPVCGKGLIIGTHSVQFHFSW